MSLYIIEIETHSIESRLTVGNGFSGSTRGPAFLKTHPPKAGPAIGLAAENRRPENKAQQWFRVDGVRDRRQRTLPRPGEGPGHGSHPWGIRDTMHPALEVQKADVRDPLQCRRKSIRSGGFGQVLHPCDQGVLMGVDCSSGEDLKVEGKRIPRPRIQGPTRRSSQKGDRATTTQRREHIEKRANPLLGRRPIALCTRKEFIGGAEGTAPNIQPDEDLMQVGHFGAGVRGTEDVDRNVLTPESTIHSLPELGDKGPDLRIVKIRLRGLGQGSWTRPTADQFDERINGSQADSGSPPRVFMPSARRCMAVISLGLRSSPSHRIGTAHHIPTELLKPRIRSRDVDPKMLEPTGFGVDQAPALKGRQKRGSAVAHRVIEWWPVCGDQISKAIAIIQPVMRSSVFGNEETPDGNPRRTSPKVGHPECVPFKGPLSDRQVHAASPSRRSSKASTDQS